jgi:chromosome transmission fidelity protein 18
LAHIIAKHAGYRPIEVNGSDERSATVLRERVVRAMESNTLSFGESGHEMSRPNCIILDEVDGADAKGAIKALVDIIKAEIPPKGSKEKRKACFLRRPIIFICNNKFAPALRPLLPFCRQLNVQPPSANRLIARLRSVLNDEQLAISGGSSLINQLVTTACGDIRSCLYTLQFVAAKARDDAVMRNRGTLEDLVTVDLSNSLTSALNGEGMKDERNDISGTLTTIFRKKKENNLKVKHSLIFKSSVNDSERVLNSVQVRLIDGNTV